MIEFLVYLLTIIGIWSLLSLSLNLQYGITGLINLGQIAFFMLGAYTSTIVAHPMLLDLPIPVGMLCGMLAASIFGVLIALPTGKLQEDYWAMSTLAAAEIVRLIFLNQSLGGPYQGSAFGVSGIPRPLREYFSTSTYGVFYLVMVGVAVLVVYWFVQRLTRMPYGRVLKAMREGDAVPLALGKNVSTMRIRTMGVGGAIGGLAGALFAHFNAFIGPTYFLPLETFLIWAMVIVGGAGNYLGAIAGAIAIQVIYNSTRWFKGFVPVDENLLASLRMAAIGVLIILVLIYMPRGILPEKKRRYVGREAS